MLRNEIIDLIDNKKISMLSIAKLSGVHYSTLRNFILNKDANITSKTIRRLEKYIKGKRLRLFDITNEYKLLQEILENDCEFNPETGEVTDNSEIIKELFEELKISLSDKLDNSAYVLNELEISSKTLKDEAKRLSERAKRIDKNADYLKSLMLEALLNVDENKLKTAKFTFSTRKSESIEIDEGFNINGEYVRVKEIREADKIAIKEALKNGKEIIGVNVITKQSLIIR